MFEATPDDGWVTFYKVQIGGQMMLVQKKDGFTRSIPTR